MSNFSKISLKRLNTCDPKLIKICQEAIKEYDFSVLCGHRGEKEQNQAFKEGRSKLSYPKSKHNVTPSKAVDIAPYPIDWNNIDRFIELSVIIKRIASENNIKIRWGGNFKNFKDYPHFELV